ncbi:autophagy protein 5, partial [Gonapodya sp. JEL0774]
AASKSTVAKEFIKAGARYVNVDYRDVHEVADALRGSDCVLSCVAVQDPQAIAESERVLVEASKLAGTVRRFFPSKYGPDDENLPQISDIGKRKKRISDLLAEVGISQTNVITGIFLEAMYADFIMKFVDHGRDAATGKDKGASGVTVGDGKGQVMGISMDDIASFVIEMIADPDESKTHNKTLRIVGGAWKAGDWPEIFRRATGRQVKTTNYAQRDAVKAGAVYPVLLQRGDFFIKPELWDNAKWPQVKAADLEQYTRKRFKEGSSAGLLPLEVVIDLPRSSASAYSPHPASSSFDSSGTHPDPVFLFAQRVSYLPLLIPTLRTRIMQLGHEAARALVEQLDPSQVWFEAENGAPLKWHYPIGLLHDIHMLHSSMTTNSTLSLAVPWRLHMKFERYPVDKIVSLRSPLLNPAPPAAVPGELGGRSNPQDGFDERMKKVVAVVQDAYINTLKQGDFLRHGSTKRIMTLDRSEMSQLWAGLETNDFNLFWPVYSRLTSQSTISSASLSSTSLAQAAGVASSDSPVSTPNPPSASPASTETPSNTDVAQSSPISTRAPFVSPRWVPIRAYASDKPVAQDLVPPYSNLNDVPEGHNETTLLRALAILVPYLVPAQSLTQAIGLGLRAVIQGVEIPLETPIIWLGQNMTYADGFVHVVVGKK